MHVHDYLYRFWIFIYNMIKILDYFYIMFCIVTLVHHMNFSNLRKNSQLKNNVDHFIFIEKKTFSSTKQSNCYFNYLYCCFISLT